MKVVNRTDQTVTWIVWNGTDNTFWGAAACEWIGPGQENNNVSVSSGGFKFYFLNGQHSAISLSRYGKDSKFIQNSDATILIQTKSLRDIVDWDSVRKQYVDGKKLTSETKSSYSQNALLASTSIKVVAECMKVIPVVGTVFSGILAIAANLADTLSKATSVSFQNDPLAFLTAIREVVRSENNRQTAESAASTFINGFTYLNSIDANNLGPHEFQDLKSNVEDFCAPGRDPMNYLTSMNLDPQKAKYITPAYLQGVASHLKFLWLHFLISLNDGDQMTPNLVNRYIRDIGNCLDGLNNLRKTVVPPVNESISASRVTVNPEWTILSQALYMSQIGLPDLTSLDSAINDVTLILELLRKDWNLLNSGQPMQHYFKRNWVLRDSIGPQLAPRDSIGPQPVPLGLTVKI